MGIGKVIERTLYDVTITLTSSISSISGVGSAPPIRGRAQRAEK